MSAMTTTLDGVLCVRVPQTPGRVCRGCLAFTPPARGTSSCAFLRENRVADCTIPIPNTHRVQYYIWVAAPEMEQDI